jgi:hypothetical protein
VEADLSLAASLAAWAIRSGVALELVTAEGRTGQGDDEAHLDRILTRLAVYAVPPAPRGLPAPTAGGRAVRITLGAGRGAEAAG